MAYKLLITGAWSLKKAFWKPISKIQNPIWYKYYLQKYIVNYEGEKENDTNDIAHFFKKLLIDAFQDLSSDIDTINKLFLTQLSLFQNIKSANIVNTLADNAFKH